MPVVSFEFIDSVEDEVRNDFCYSVIEAYGRLQSFWCVCPVGTLKMVVFGNSDTLAQCTGLGFNHAYPIGRKIFTTLSASPGHEISHCFYYARPDIDLPDVFDEAFAHVLGGLWSPLEVDILANKQLERNKFRNEPAAAKEVMNNAMVCASLLHFVLIETQSEDIEGFGTIGLDIYSSKEVFFSKLLGYLPKWLRWHEKISSRIGFLENLYRNCVKFGAGQSLVLLHQLYDDGLPIYEACVIDCTIGLIQGNREVVERALKMLDQTNKDRFVPSRLVARRSFAEGWACTNKEDMFGARFHFEKVMELYGNIPASLKASAKKRLELLP